MGVNIIKRPETPTTHKSKKLIGINSLSDIERYFRYDFDAQNDVVNLNAINDSSLNNEFIVPATVEGKSIILNLDKLSDQKKVSISGDNLDIDDLCDYINYNDTEDFYRPTTVRQLREHFGILSDTNNTLTLQCLKYTSNLPKTVWIPENVIDPNTQEVYSIKLPEDMEEFFREQDQVEMIGFDSVKITEPRTTMKYAFRYCQNLKVVNLQQVQGLSNVVNMQGMFEGCSRLKKVLFPTADHADGVTVLRGMFKDCRRLEEIDMTFFDYCEGSEGFNLTRNMFKGCNSLKRVHTNNGTVELEADKNEIHYH